MKRSIRHPQHPNFRTLLAIAAIVAAIGQQANAQSARRADAAIHRGVDAGFDRAARIQELVEHAMEHSHSDEEGGGGCVALPEFSIMFEPTATATQIETTLAQIPDDGLAYFIEHSRWTSTATNGAVVADQAITLTYSFVPDGTPVFLSTTGNSAATDLFATFDSGYPGGRAAWQAKVRAMFDRWSEVTNITYLEVADDGAGFPLAPGQLGARGDIRIAARPIGAGPLAVNFFPAFGGDMVIDSDDIGTFANPASDFVQFFNVLAHEHGHGLGLQHVEPQNATKLMEPVLNTAFTGPQEDDIRGGRYFYGDALEPNNSFAESQFFGDTLRTVNSVGVQTITIENVALERQGVSDFYKFTAFAQVPIAIRVEPIGTQYQFGPQGGSASLFDAKAARDLGLRLYRHAGNGSLQLLAQIDFNDAGADEYHPPIPYSLAGQMVLEVFSTDGVDDVQNYRVRISNAAIEAFQEPSVLRVFNGATELGDSSTVLFTATEIGAASTRTLQILNSGTGPLEIGQPSLQGPAAGDYSFTLLQSTVQPGATAQLLVTFAPSAAGQRVALLNLPNNDPNREDFSFIVSGTAVVPQVPAIEVRIDGVLFDSNDAFDFGEIALNVGGSAELNIRNAGNAQLSISTISMIGTNNAEFATTISNATLSPGASVTGQISTTPAQEGVRIARLRIISNAAPTTFFVDLAAIGVVPIADCNNNGIDDGTDIANGTSTDCDGNAIPDECEADSDNDGAIDACDQFPGQDDNLDSDNDGVVDGLDECPNDPNKTTEGLCGCGVADEDDDNDGVLNCDDAFPNDPNNGVDPDDNGNNNDDGNDDNVGDDDDGVIGEDTGNDDDAGNDDPVIDDNQDDNFDDNAGQDVNGNVDPEDFDIDLNDDESFDLLPNPCGFGLLPGLMISAMSLTAGRSTRRRRVLRAVD